MHTCQLELVGGPVLTIIAGNGTRGLARGRALGRPAVGSGEAVEVDAILGQAGDPAGAPVPPGDAQGSVGTKTEAVAGLGHAATAVGPNVAGSRVH